MTYTDDTPPPSVRLRCGCTRMFRAPEGLTHEQFAEAFKQWYDRLVAEHACPNRPAPPIPAPVMEGPHRLLRARRLDRPQGCIAD